MRRVGSVGESDDNLRPKGKWEPAADYANYADADLHAVHSASTLHLCNSRNPRLIPCLRVSIQADFRLSVSAFAGCI